MGIVRFIGYIHVLVFDQFSALEPCSHHLANRIDRVDAPPHERRTRRRPYLD